MQFHLVAITLNNNATLCTSFESLQNPLFLIKDNHVLVLFCFSIHNHLDQWYSTKGISLYKTCTLSLTFLQSLRSISSTKNISVVDNPHPKETNLQLTSYARENVRTSSVNVTYGPSPAQQRECDKNHSVYS